MSQILSAIEAASTSLYKGSLNEQQEAHNFLLEWKNSPECEANAFEILNNNSFSIYAKMTSISVIKDISKNKLYNYDIHMLESLKNKVIELARLYSNCVNENIVLSEISVVLACIALYIWPENWPNFPFDILGPIENPHLFDNKTGFYISLLRELIFEILNSRVINSNKRVYLISCFSFTVPQILDFIIPIIDSFEQICFDILNFNLSISLLSDLLRISPISFFNNENILNHIVNGISSNNEDIHNKWVIFASNLLLKHPERQSIINSFLKPILEISFLCGQQNGKSSNNLCIFTLEFLIEYLKLIIKINDPGLNEILSKLLILLSKQPLTEQTDLALIWFLWLQIFRLDFLPKLPLNFDQLTVLFDLLLPTFTSEGFVKNKTAVKSFSAFYECFADQINNIIIQSSLVPQITIATGIIWRSMKKDVELAIANQFYSKIICNEVDPPTLFAISFCFRFLRSNIEAQSFLSRILENIIQNIDLNSHSSSNDLHISMSYALKYISNSVPEIFFNNKSLLKTLLSNINYYLFNEFEDCGKRIFKVIHKLLSNSTSDDFTYLEINNEQIFSTLAQYILNMISNNQTLYNGLACLCSLDLQSPLYKLLLDPLLQILENILSDNFSCKDIVDKYINVIAMSFASLPFSSIESSFLNILKILSGKNNLYVQTFKFLEIIRKSHIEVDNYFFELFENLILPYITKSGKDIDREFFDMIKIFPDTILCDQIILSISYGINDLRADVVQSSAECIFKHNFEYASIILFLNQTLSSLFDMIHSNSFSTYVNLLQHFFVKTIYNSTVEQFKIDFCHSLTNICNDQNKASQLFILLKDNLHQKEFKEALKEFLVDSHFVSNEARYQMEQNENHIY